MVTPHVVTHHPVAYYCTNVGSPCLLSHLVYFDGTWWYYGCLWKVRDTSSGQRVTRVTSIWSWRKKFSLGAVDTIIADPAGEALYQCSSNVCWSAINAWLAIQDSHCQLSPVVSAAVTCSFSFSFVVQSLVLIDSSHMSHLVSDVIWHCLVSPSWLCSRKANSCF